MLDGAVEPLLRAYHMRYAHVMVVDHVRQVVGGQAAVEKKSDFRARQKNTPVRFQEDRVAFVP